MYIRFVSGFVFAAVSVLHALRLALRWEMVIGGWLVPTWLSVVGLLVAGYLASCAFRLARRLGH